MLLTLGSMALGVSSLILAGGFIDDMLAQLRDATIHSQLGHFQVFAPGYADDMLRDPLSHTIPNYVEAVRKLKAIAHVEIVAARLTLPGLISNGRSQLPATIEGIDPQAEARIGTAFQMIAGSNLSESSTAIVGEGVARALKLKVGDPLTVLCSTREGALNTIDLKIAGIFRTAFKDFDARAVRMALSDAQQLANEPVVGSLVVLLDRDESVDAAVTNARSALPSERFDIRPWWTLADFYRSTVALYRRQLLVLEVIVTLMVILGVANTLNMSLHERQPEFGTIRALGYRPSAIIRQIMLESALLGCIAAIVGMLAGGAIAAVVSAFGIDMPPPPNSDLGYTASIRLSFANLALAAAIGVVASILGAMAPALRLSRIPIVSALRYSI